MLFHVVDMVNLVMTEELYETCGVGTHYHETFPQL